MPVFFKSMSSKITSLPTWVNILCISFFVTLIVTPESYRYSAVTLSILALVTLHKTKHAFAKRELQIIAFSLLVYFLAYIIEMVVFSQSTRTIDLPSRTAFASFCLSHSLIFFLPFLASFFPTFLANLFLSSHYFYLFSFLSVKNCFLL